MILIGELFDKNLSEELLDIYWQILEPFNDEQCEQAFKKVMASAKWYPKPADILEYLIPKRFDEVDFSGVSYQNPPEIEEDKRTPEQRKADLEKLRKFAGGIFKNVKNE